MKQEKQSLKVYYSIGEVADMFHVNTSLIRFWEKEFDMTLKGAQQKLCEEKSETEANFEIVKRLQHVREELLQIKAELDYPE